ncbi:hypothetical protein EC968_007165 [Mortierella alpina]|nr:hypothetical protein EC968_007165 [Mortierella alpina]
MKLERWAKNLFKSSSSWPHPSEPYTMDATLPSRRSMEQSNLTSWSTLSAHTQRRHKTFFGFSSRNASLGSLLSVAYGSGMTDPSRERRHILGTNVSTTTIESLRGDVGNDRGDGLEHGKEPETTTIYYHPPPHATQNQHLVQATEIRKDGEQQQLIQAQLVEEARKLARRRLERLGHLPKATASGKGAVSPNQPHVKIREPSFFFLPTVNVKSKYQHG